jgi:FtsP/CotA-like multicopper oxidase with cupredoxin domain
MHYNSDGERVSRARFKEMYNAFRNRQELIKAGLMNRRSLMKMGLLTSAGYLVAKNGLSSRAWGQSWGGGGGGQCASPATTAFSMPLPIMPIKQPVSSLSPAPTINPNTAINPATGLPFEGRTRAHQGPGLGLPFPPPRLYQVTQRAALVNMSNQLPLQPIWGFDGISPGPTYVSAYGIANLVRNVNNLQGDNSGFGLPSVSTHLHNGHTPSESDGFPCDYFASGQYYDHYYPNVLAGFASTHAPNGDINESLSTLWYHDHRVDFTAQNVYKGLTGFYLLFNQFDTGDETTGFRLPSFPNYDIPMMFADRCFDPTTGLLAFDTFNLDGILGDRFLVNGVIQPVLHVSPRRYRFRWLNSGPSRFYQLYLTNPASLSTVNTFWQISNDGNLLPSPFQVGAVALGVAERADVVVDFTGKAGQTFYIENRLVQTDGRGPISDSLTSAGQGNLLLKIVVDGPVVADNSRNLAVAPLPTYYALPDKTATPRVRRSFNFDQTRDGEWTINDKFFSCNEVRFRVKRNSVEVWDLRQNRSDWQHPIHIHFEEFQILAGAAGLYPLNGSSGGWDGGWSGGGWGGGGWGDGSSGAPVGVNIARKDVVRLTNDTQPTLFFRFRDFVGRYPMHCHNVIHEDHAMMVRWDIDDTGDTRSNP